MCGIAGFNGQDRQKMERMTEALIHRGPDGNDVFTDHGISLGHARLAILDPRPEGDQPMWNDDKTVVIVYNGEIFNYRALRDKEGLTCKTTTDTEVILKLYERYGMSFLPRLRGMFAFGLYDTKTKTWFIARDPSGIKPLYVATVDGNIHFASEMRSLLRAFKTKPAIDMESLSQFLRLQYVPGPRTMCVGIESLAPGTLITWRDGKEERTHVAANAVSEPYRTKQDFKEHFPAVMDEVVHDHLVSDRPIGIFLSGGMDSSIVLHHMAKHSTEPIRTFTVRFDATKEEGEERFNTDANLAKQTAAHYGTKHEEVLLTAELCRELYRETTKHLDQPNADAVSTAQFLLSRIAKKSADVTLTGAGGDELFGGYPRYRVAKILHAARMVPAGMRRMLGTFTGKPSDVLALSPGAALAERLLARPMKEVDEIVKGNWFMHGATTQLFEKRFAALPKQMDPLRAFMEFDRGLWLVDESLRLADATTMGSGLEGRVPFLDARIIAASHATPSDWHVSLSETKTILKDTYRTILPEHLFTLKKASFYPPLAKWIRREAAPLVDEALQSERIAEFFDVAVLRNINEQHKKKERYALHQLSNILQLAYWFETVYDAA